MNPINFNVPKVNRRWFLGWLLKASSVVAAFGAFGSAIFKPLAAKPATPKSTTGQPAVVFPDSASRLLLRNGLIVDGTGGKAFQGDVMIHGEKIETVSPTPIEFQGKVVNCSGMVIAPGFIDMHSHMDWVMPVPGHPELKSPFTRQGITTFVTGNCGFGVAGFKPESRFRPLIENNVRGLYPLTWNSMADYYQIIRQQGITHNILNLAGHGTTRTSLQGFDEKPVQGDSLKEMLYLLEEALEQGAHGVSFGLQYEPGIFAKKEELQAIAHLVGQKQKIITVHMKAYSSLSGTYPLELFGTPHNLLAIDDMLELAKETGVKMQLSHLIFVGERTWKTTEQALSKIEQARKAGLDIKFDTYAYHCGTSIINVVLPEWFLAQIPEVFESRLSLLKLKAELTLIKNLLGFGYEDIQITKAEHPDLEQFNGMFLKDIAIKRNKGEFENFIDFVRMSKGKAAVLNHRYSNLDQVKALIKHPDSLFQTDALVALEGTQNPACYGNFPRILQYAREFDLLSLEAVVHKMTGAAAERFGIVDRGELKAGKAADVVVFDWNQVKDNTTTEKTDQFPSGIATVLINGRLVLTDGQPDTTALPGKVL